MENLMGFEGTALNLISGGKGREALLINILTEQKASIVIRYSSEVILVFWLNSSYILLFLFCTLRIPNIAFSAITTTLEEGQLGER